MTRSPDTGAITGYIRDTWGWTVTFTAIRDDDGYRLDCILGDIPKALRIPVLDDAP